MPMPAKKKKVKSSANKKSVRHEKVKPAGNLRLKLHRVTSAKEFRMAMGLKDESAYKIHALLQDA